MPKNFRNTLLKILDIIEFSDDKSTFVDEFLRNVQLQSLDNLIQSLPEDKQKEIRQNLSRNSDNPKKVAEILKMHFTEAQMQKALETVSKTAIETYFKTINETLSPAQKNNLASFFEQLKPVTTV